MKELAPHFLQRTSPPGEEETAVLSRPVVPEDSGLDLRDYWRVITKHSWLIAAFFFGTVLATTLVVLTMTPIYTAETTLLIERKAPQVVDVQQALSESLGPDEYDYYKTQYQILKSRVLAAQVIRELGLEKNGLFTGEGREGLVARLWAAVRARGKRLFSQPSDTDGATQQAKLLGVDPGLIDLYTDGMLEIRPVQRTRLVKVAFLTPDPGLSARVANAHAESYIHKGLELRTQTNEEAQRFLEEKLVELKERVEKSEAALNRYRRDKGIISLDDKENIVVARLTDLNARLTDAEAERIGLEAQMRSVSQTDYDSLPAVVNNTLIQALKEQLTTLQGQYAQLSTQFKPAYPRLAQLKAQVVDTEQRVQKEIQRVVEGVKTSYLDAEAKEKELRAKMEEQKAITLSLKDDSVQYAILDREADTNRQLYDSVLQRMKEMGVAADVRASNVSVIDEAEPPLRPSSPKKGLSLLLSSFVGLVGGVGLAFFFEYLDNTLKTPEEVERYLRLPNLAVVPDFLGTNGRGYGYYARSYGYGHRARHQALEKKAELLGQEAVPEAQSNTPSKELVVSAHPLSVVSEAYRTLRTAILLSRAGEPPRTILFTSGTHSEGKTASTINTAIVFAQMGVKVLVIDADLRRPRCHKVLGIASEPGLTELLTGQREPQEVARPTAIENLFLISCGSSPPNPAELVGSRKMQETLAFLQAHFDYVLIDSPPVMPVSDAILLSTMVDGVVLVVGGQETPKHVVREARARLGYARAKILGVMLNRVNMQSGDYSYYYRHYYGYYNHTEAEKTGLSNNAED